MQGIMKILRTSILISLLAASFACAPSGSEAAEIKKAETAWTTAVSKSDASAVARLLSDDLVYAHSTGLAENKSQYLAKLKTGAQKYDSIQYSDQKIRIFGNTAVVNGTFRMTGSTNGVPFDNTLLVTHVWVKQGNDWKLVSHQTTKKAA
jgi:ketosteroid isomerase-like protein